MKNVAKKMYIAADLFKRVFFDLGLLRSIFECRAVDGKEQHVPWFSFPAIEFLDGINLDAPQMKDLRIFEFGIGSSTRYWTRRLSESDNQKDSRYVGVERNEEYFEQFTSERADLIFYPGRVTDVRIYNRDTEYLGSLYQRGLQYGQFDIIVVDGPMTLKRSELHEATFPKRLASDGMIVVDDANWLEENIESIFCKNMYRVDFSGLSPGCSYVKTTSLLFPTKEGMEKWFFAMNRKKISPARAGMASFPH